MKCFIALFHGKCKHNNMYKASYLVSCKYNNSHNVYWPWLSDGLTNQYKIDHDWASLAKTD